MKKIGGRALVRPPGCQKEKVMYSERTGSALLAAAAFLLSTALSHTEHLLSLDF